MWLSVGSASSLFVPTLTCLSALPWLPVTGALGAVLDLPEMRASAVLGSSQPRLGSERDEAVLRPRMPAEDSSCCEVPSASAPSDTPQLNRPSAATSEMTTVRGDDVDMGDSPGMG